MTNFCIYKSFKRRYDVLYQRKFQRKVEITSAKQTFDLIIIKLQPYDTFANLTKATAYVYHYRFVPWQEDSCLCFTTTCSRKY